MIYGCHIILMIYMWCIRMLPGSVLNTFEHSITVFFRMLAAQVEHLMHRKSLSLAPGFHLFPGDSFLAKLELSRLVQDVARAGS